MENRTNKQSFLVLPELADDVEGLASAGDDPLEVRYLEDLRVSLLLEADDDEPPALLPLS